MKKNQSNNPARKGDVLAAASDSNSRNDTEHLLASPANAERLRSAIRSSRAGEGVVMTVDELRAQVGLDVPGTSS